MTIPDIQARLQAFARPDFTFDADAHEYALKGQPLVSWSKWIEQYANPFPEQQAAAASASKRGITTQQVLDEWEWSRTLGTLVHAWIEQWWGFDEEPAPHGHADVRLRCEKFVRLYHERLISLTPLAMELQANHAPAGVAGTLDFIGHRPARAGVCVLDWKTNSEKSFTRNSQINGYTKRMRGAMCDLYETKETLYSLQNSFYRVLLEEAGIPTEMGAIIWLPPGDAPGEIIWATDFRARIRSLLF